MKRNARLRCSKCLLRVKARKKKHGHQECAFCTTRIDAQQDNKRLQQTKSKRLSGNKQKHVLQNYQIERKHHGQKSKKKQSG